MSLDKQINDLLNTYKPKALPLLKDLELGFRTNPDLRLTFDATIAQIIMTAAGIRTARKLQPILYKLINGETLTRRDSYHLYSYATNFTGCLVATSYIAYMNARQLRGYQDRKKAQ
jgi:hypothetical protein